jgi:glycosyltransferase involved in cell wall biosynthesis
MFRRHPSAMLVLVGACTDTAYGEQVNQQIRDLGLAERVLLTGGLPPADPRLVGLLQNSRALILPSVSETFGLIILEAWASGTTVISSRTSGPSSLIRHGENGFLFDLENPASFIGCVDEILNQSALTGQFAEAGRRVIADKHDANVLAGRMRDLYAQLIEEKKYAPCHSA